MKKLMTIIALTLVSLSSQAAVNLTCEQSFINQEGYYDVMGGVKNISILDCEDKNREQYTMLIKGYGLGIKFALGSVYGVACPTVNKRKLMRRGKVVLGTAKVNAGIFFGVNGAVAANHKGGVCVLGGVDIAGLAASAAIGKMVIYTGTARDNYKSLKKYLPEHMED